MHRAGTSATPAPARVAAAAAAATATGRRAAGNVCSVSPRFCAKPVSLLALGAPLLRPPARTAPPLPRALPRPSHAHCPAPPHARRKCACAFRPRGAPHARSGCSALLPARRQPWAPMQQELPRCASSPRPRPPVRRRHTATVAARRAIAATACLSAAACGAACASLRPKRSARRSLLAPSCAPLFAPSLPVHSLLAARRPTPDARRLCLTRAPLAALLSRNDPVRILRGLAPLAAARQL
jgi:hypothetical protein